MNFRKFLEHNPLHIPMPMGGNTVGVHNDGNRDGSMGSFLPTTWTGSEDLGIMGYGLPGTDISLPTVTRDCVIIRVLNAPAEDRPRRENDKSQKDLIRVEMQDGTNIYLPLFRYLDLMNSGRKIKPGEKLRVTFMRNPSDTSRDASRVIRID